MDWIASVLSLCARWMTGNKDKRGWIFSYFNQFIWLYLIWKTELWGVLPLTVSFIFISARNYWKWRKEEIDTGVYTGYLSAPLK